MGILDKIKDSIKGLVNKNKTRNPFELAEALGIILVEAPLKDGLNGCYHERSGFQFIYINSDLPYEKRLMVAAHELGHAILHEDKNILFISRNTLQSKDKLEKQANKFAAEILLDDNIFSEYYGYSLEEISKCECVSYELVEHKYNNLNK